MMVLMQFSNLIPDRLKKNQTTIPVVRLHGAILAQNSPMRSNLNLASVAAPLQRAFETKHSPAVALSVNSPGGSPVQSRLIVSRIRELSKKHDKKVLVFVEDVAASGGYMISLAGDEIYADETSIIGSIGVIYAGFGFDKAIAKLGVDRRVYTAGKNKLTLDSFQEEKKDDVEYLKSLQTEIHDVFINMVKENRGEKLKPDDDMFTGRFWTGTKAKALGLIDGLGHMSQILKEKYGEKTKLKLVTPKRGLFGRVASPGVSTWGASLPSDLGASMGSAVVDQSMAQFDERQLWSRYGL